MKEYIILWATKYILKYVNAKTVELEQRERNGEEVEFIVNRYRIILSSIYDLRTEMYKEINKIK